MLESRRGPTSSCLSPFLRHFCLFPCPLSSMSPLFCLSYPLLHPPLLFSLLLPGSPHILVSSPPPALPPSFSCSDLTLSTLSYPNFPLRRRIPWPPPSATGPQRPHCRLPLGSREASCQDGAPGYPRRWPGTEWGGLLGLSPVIFGIEACPPAPTLPLPPWRVTGRGGRLRAQGPSPSNP